MVDLMVKLKAAYWVQQLVDSMDVLMAEPLDEMKVAYLVVQKAAL